MQFLDLAGVKRIKQYIDDSIVNFITNSVSNLTNYYLKSETYTKSEVEALIAAINQFHYEIAASTSAVSSPANNVLYLIGPTGTGEDKYEEYVYSSSNWVKIGDTSISLSGYVTTQMLNTALADYTNTTTLNTLLAGKQDVINDLSDIRTGSQNNVKYTSQSLTDTQKTQARTNIGAGTYSKPSSGIPATDLASAVQTSLGKADTALQSFTETDPTVPSWAKQSTKPTYTASEVGALPDTTVIPTSVVQYAAQSLTDAEKAQARTNIGAGTYSKPATGIPASDIASGVIPTTLPASDVYAWAKAATKPSYTASEIGALPDTTVIPTVPTISTNVVSDKTSDIKTSSPKSVYSEIHPTVVDTQPSGGFAPNIFYRLGTITGSATFSLVTPTDNTIENEYHWSFTAGNPAPTITWPSGIEWVGGESPTINAGQKYEISILDNIAGNILEPVSSGGGSSYTLPIASASGLGGIKVGSGLSIDSTTGVLSATGGSSDEENVIETVKVNGTALIPDENKAVDVQTLWVEGTGTNSIAVKGSGGTAGGNYSAVEGKGCVTGGNYTENNLSADTADTTSGSYSHAEGRYTIANGGAGSHSEGNRTIASGKGSHSEGNQTIASNTGSHAEGSSTIASGQSSHAEGYLTFAEAMASHSEGRLGRALGQASHVEGASSVVHIIINGDAGATEYYATSTSTDFIDLYNLLGSSIFTQIIQNSSIAIQNNVSSVRTIVSVSNVTLSNNTISFTFTLNKTISDSAVVNNNSYDLYFSQSAALSSHSEGSVAFGTSSHAEGTSFAIGNKSHTEGNCTISLNANEHAEGQYNVSNKTSDIYGNSGNTQHSIGIGTESARKNAVEVMQNGDMYVYGVGGYDGTNISQANTLQYSLGDKQNLLVSGTNIKTINNQSLLGSGNVSVGTITGITMNGSSKGTSGVVNLGTVLTEHQDISGKASLSGAAFTGAVTGTSSGNTGQFRNITISSSEPTSSSGSNGDIWIVI